VKLKSSSAFYLITIGGTAIIIAFILNAGKNLVPAHALNPDLNPQFQDQNQAGNYPLGTFILQITLIIFAARLLGWFFLKIGQPSVIGEILAGILLGPSVMGAFFPDFSRILFPVSSLGNLQMFSQVGLIIFMFLVGMELDLKILKKNLGPALVISHASIIIPFALGTAISYFLYTAYAASGIPFYAFALFMGIALSITAFPVLARIIRERGLTHTRLGNIAITCAAIDDITAWCLLALVLAIVKAGKPDSWFSTILLVSLYGLTMLFAVKPILKKIFLQNRDKKIPGRPTLTIIFIILLLSAYCTQTIGINVLFGSFIAGIIMPADAEFRKIITHKIEDIALVLLLPIFFVVTGLRTRIGLLDQPSLWVVFLMILAIALAGKFGSASLAARFTGESLKDSLSIGALMNTRGLVELVVLNIGFDLHILTPVVFTMMVLMALITTCMTNPVLSLIDRIWAEKRNPSRLRQDG
jgi:Kef-type K+ transport system membrane component KefB